MLAVMQTAVSGWHRCYRNLRQANPSRNGAGVIQALPISAFLEMSEGNILDKHAKPTDKIRMYIAAQTKAEAGISISTTKSQGRDIILP